MLSKTAEKPSFFKVLYTIIDFSSNSFLELAKTMIDKLTFCI